MHRNLGAEWRLSDGGGGSWRGTRARTATHSDYPARRCALRVGRFSLDRPVLLPAAGQGTASLELFLSEGPAAPASPPRLGRAEASR